MTASTPNRIGTLNEKPLHAALKVWIAEPGDCAEVRVGRYVIDLVRGDLLIEIQTRHFSAIRAKLQHLVTAHPLRLVYAVAAEKWIVRQDANGVIVGRRRSPRHGSAADVVAELVSVPTLLAHPNFSLDGLLIHEEELRRPDPRRGWRRGGWVIQERRLLGVVGAQRFTEPADLLGLLPDPLPEAFTTAQIAAAAGRTQRWAQRLADCLRALALIERCGQWGRALLYRRRE